MRESIKNPGNSLHLFLALFEIISVPPTSVTNSEGHWHGSSLPDFENPHRTQPKMRPDAVKCKKWQLSSTALSKVRFIRISSLALVLVFFKDKKNQSRKTTLTAA